MFPDELNLAIGDLRTMVKIRRLEEEVRDLRLSGEVVDLAHLLYCPRGDPTGVLGDGGPPARCRCSDLSRSRLGDPF